MSRIWTYLSVLAILFMGCSSEPKFDVDTVVELKSEVEEIKSELPEGRAEEFQRAYDTVVEDEGLATIAKGVEMFDGKTVSDVIAMADSVNQEKIEGLNSEIEKMRTLDGVIVQSASITFPEGDFIDPGPSPMISIRNETDHPLKDIEFLGEWKSPDRPVSWWEGELYCRPEGGLKIDEERKVTCSFRGLSKPEEREDANFTVEVVGIEAANGSPDFKYEETLESKTAELDSLKGLVAE